jgi:hypothetical protein
MVPLLAAVLRQHLGQSVSWVVVAATPGRFRPGEDDVDALLPSARRFRFVVQIGASTFITSAASNTSTRHRRGGEGTLLERRDPQVFQASVARL